jgi:hypothetical protein
MPLGNAPAVTFQVSVPKPPVALSTAAYLIPIVTGLSAVVTMAIGTRGRDTAVEGREAGPLPTVFEAVTVNVY